MAKIGLLGRRACGRWIYLTVSWFAAPVASWVTPSLHVCPGGGLPAAARGPAPGARVAHGHAAGAPLRPAAGAQTTTMTRRGGGWGKSGGVVLGARGLRSTSGERGDAREILGLALPVLASGIVDPFLSMVDTAYCGRLGTAALASLGPCVSLFHLSFNCFGSIRSTTTALISSALAQSDADFERDPKNAEGKAAAAEMGLQSLVLAGVTGVAISGLLLCKGDAALSLMGLPPGSPLLPAASNYLKVRDLKVGQARKHETHH